MEFNKAEILNLLKKEEKLSKEPIRVACLIYGQDSNKEWKFLSSGFNLIDFELPKEYGCERIPFVKHAEMSAIFNMNEDWKKYSNLIAFISYISCHNCIKLLDSIGIKKVFYEKDLYDGFGYFLFEVTKRYCRYKKIELKKL